MKYQILTSKKYKTQFKKHNQQNRDLIDSVVFKLANGEKLAAKHKDHNLKGKYKDFRGCHIKLDLLLIYRIHHNVLELYLSAVGSHSELFDI